MRYWIDTDAELDDALALLLALRQVGPALVGISAVHGGLTEPTVASNLSRLLAAYAGRGLIAHLPLLTRGAGEPLAGSPVRASETPLFDSLGGFGLPINPEHSPRWSTLSAAVQLARAVRRHRDLHLVCIGPLTNLALGLELEPELPSLLAGLTIMGGSLRLAGNASSTAEFNFLADPEAARLVLEAGFRAVSLIPLDACGDLCVRPSELARLRDLEDAGASIAVELLQFSEEKIRRTQGLTLYDPAAWLLTLRPELTSWESLHVTVESAPGSGLGACLVDAERPSNLRAAVGAKPGQLFEALLEALS